MRAAYNADKYRTDARHYHSILIKCLEEFKRNTGKSLCEIKDSLSSVLSSVGAQDAKIVSVNWEHHNAGLLKLDNSTTLSALQEQWFQ